MTNRFILFAGPFAPRRDAADWLPTYHIVQLGVDGLKTTENYVVRFTLEISTRPTNFVLDTNERDEKVDEP